ncbi:hypothetical protein ACL02O_28560, partial [Micromonospora sp. MS34]|uniref:hypothetical protein n=1 Tax=Micromonospora sp. MS34 TaxID=3385971 RepID=UPI00399F88B3
MSIATRDVDRRHRVAAASEGDREITGAAADVEHPRAPHPAVEHRRECRLRTTDDPGRPARVGCVTVELVVVVAIGPVAADLGVAHVHRKPPGQLARRRETRGSTSIHTWPDAGRRRSYVADGNAV